MYKRAMQGVHESIVQMCAHDPVMEELFRAVMEVALEDMLDAERAEIFDFPQTSYCTLLFSVYRHSMPKLLKRFRPELLEFLVLMHSFAIAMLQIDTTLKANYQYIQAVCCAFVMFLCVFA